MGERRRGYARTSATAPADKPLKFFVLCNSAFSCRFLYLRRNPALSARLIPVLPPSWTNGGCCLRLNPLTASVHQSALPSTTEAGGGRVIGGNRHSWRVYISARVNAGGGRAQSRRAQLRRGEHGFECRLLILYTELYCAVCAFLANYIEYFMNEEIDKYKTCNYYIL